MDDRSFRTTVDAIYAKVLQRLDKEDPDIIEGEMNSGVVRIRNARGQVYVLNVQPPLQEVWYAAGDRAWHFKLDGQKWTDPRNGDELNAVLNATVSQAAGKPIQFVL
jgi:iron donor protein CyaY